MWPTRSGDIISDRMNALPKYVVSTTLTDATWHNTTVIDHDPFDALRDLKQQPSGSSGTFELADSIRLGSGIVILVYRTSAG